MQNDVNAFFTADATGDLIWYVQGATVRASLNAPYIIELEVRSESANVDPHDMLGSNAELRVERQGLENGWGGLVSSVQGLPHPDSWTHARIIIEPALSALRHGRDTKIFQEKTVPEILQEVLSAELGAYGRSVRVETQRSYPKREYTVQYQESHYAFTHRLMEEEGILYRFERAGDKEVMVIFDDKSQHPPVESVNGALLDYSEVDAHEGSAFREYVNAFLHTSKIQATKISTRHFDWTHPSVLIEGQSPQDAVGDPPNGAAWGPERESYEHDEQLTLHQYAHLYNAHDKDDQVRLRREAQKRDAALFKGKSTVIGIRAGLRFDLQQHPSVELNAAYVVTHVTHRILSHVQEGDSHRYSNVMRCIGADDPWRPKRIHPRPRIRGIQTAIVVGPAGEEIHCDEHARVKVQFHWDREGQMNEHSSRWVRVQQSWAGRGWGALVIPRINMEVVVSFIDGDPDRPIITGCVYNGDNNPPYLLPDEKTRSTFKSNSSLGGGGYNEFRFEDKAGQEEIFTHAEKDYNEVVENDHNTTVHNCQSNTVDVHQTEVVGVNQTMTVGMDRIKNIGVNENVSIGQDQRILVGNNRDEMVGVNEDVQIGGDRTHRISGKSMLKVQKKIDIFSDVQILLRAKNSTILMK